MGAKLSGSGGGRYAVEANSEINVTPFVDVMLVLLIIFMVAAPMAAVTVKVTLPNAVAKPSTNPPKPVYISIQESGRLFIGDIPTEIATLGSTCGRISATSVTRRKSGSSSAPTKGSSTGTSWA